MNFMNIMNRMEQAQRKSASDRTRIAKAERIARDEGIECIYEMNAFGDFVEVKGEIGNDLICYRIYDDGRVYER